MFVPLGPKLNQIMEKQIDYQVCYEVTSTIKYLNEEDPGEHYFSIRRDWEGVLWDSEDDEAMAYVGDGKVLGVEGYGSCIRPEEEIVIRELMAIILAK